MLLLGVDARLPRLRLTATAAAAVVAASLAVVVVVVVVGGGRRCYVRDGGERLAYFVEL